MRSVGDILGAMRTVEGELLRIEGADDAPWAVVNPAALRVELTAGASARLVVVHDAATSSSLQFDLASGARLEVTEVFTAEAFVEVGVKQAAHSACRVTTVQLTSANATYTVDLDGCEAESTFGGVFLASGEEHCLLHLRTNHNASDCRSDSYIKGVASGCSVGEFCGLVYVAQDAQRTDARQQSRNILLSETARIVTRPQLEIYADDVKCSHGATVGQIDADAVLYMRQRGLSEAQARRLQIEGFAADVVRHCGIGELCDALMCGVTDKMERM